MQISLLDRKPALTKSEGFEAISSSSGLREGVTEGFDSEENFQKLLENLAAQLGLYRGEQELLSWFPSDMVVKPKEEKLKDKAVENRECCCSGDEDKEIAKLETLNNVSPPDSSTTTSPKSSGESPKEVKEENQRQNSPVYTPVKLSDKTGPVLQERAPYTYNQIIHTHPVEAKISKPKESIEGKVLKMDQSQEHALLNPNSQLLENQNQKNPRFNLFKNEAPSLNNHSEQDQTTKLQSSIALSPSLDIAKRGSLQALQASFQTTNIEKPHMSQVINVTIKDDLQGIQDLKAVKTNLQPFLLQGPNTKTRNSMGEQENTKAVKTPLPSLTNRMLERVEATLREVAHSRNGKSISVYFDPPSLGSMRVDVSLREGALHARLITDSPQANLILRDKAQELQSYLRSAGLDVDEIKISVGYQEGNFSGGDFNMFKYSTPEQGSFSSDSAKAKNAEAFEPVTHEKAILQELDHWVA